MKFDEEKLFKLYTEYLSIYDPEHHYEPDEMLETDPDHIAFWTHASGKRRKTVSEAFPDFRRDVMKTGDAEKIRRFEMYEAVQFFATCDRMKTL